MTPIYIAFEEARSEAVLQRLVLEANPGLQVAVSIGGKGNGYLKEKLPALIKTAYKIPVLLLTDLDDSPCAPELITCWCGQRVLPGSMLFRVAVREIEAWLLADCEGFSRFSGIPKTKIPIKPENLADPKQTLLNLVRRYGRRNIKSDLLPAADSHAKVGFGYNAALRVFVNSLWSIESASLRADSLRRAWHKLNGLTL